MLQTPAGVLLEQHSAPAKEELGPGTLQDLVGFLNYPSLGIPPRTDAKLRHQKQTAQPLSAYVMKNAKCYLPPRIEQDADYQCSQSHRERTLTTTQGALINHTQNVEQISFLACLISETLEVSHLWRCTPKE